MINRDIDESHVMDDFPCDSGTYDMPLPLPEPANACGWSTDMLEKRRYIEDIPGDFRCLIVRRLLPDDACCGSDA